MVRLTWWLGFYIAAQLPLIPWIYHFNKMIWFVFPMGLEWPFFILTTGFVPQPSSSMPGSVSFLVQILDTIYTIVMAVFPWAIYAVHLIFSLCVRKRRRFLILMWILGAIVLFNLASCASFLHNPPQ